MIVPVHGLDDHRLGDYRALTQPDSLRERGVFAAEGRLVVTRLVSHRGFNLRSLLLTTAAFEALGEMVQEVPDDVPVFVTSHEVMNGVVGFNIHRGCVAMADRPRERTLADLNLSTASRLVVAEGVNNPDNIGGLFRNAAALGADAVVLGPGCSDPLYRKAIRTSMAATLLVPWAHAGTWPDAIAAMRSAGLTVLACTPDGDAPSLYEVTLPLRAAVLMGAEGDGLSADALAAADVRLRIPMRGAMDSLNVATAAAIVLSALDAASKR